MDKVVAAMEEVVVTDANLIVALFIQEKGKFLANRAFISMLLPYKFTLCVR